MPLVSMRQLLDHAAENGYGLPAFNVNNLEQIQAIMEAAQETNSPVIMQGSAGARKYAASPSICIQSMRSGFSSVMMDGSLLEDAKTPASFDYNCKVTRHVVDIAHAIGVSVEGELGCLGSLESGMGEKEDGHGAEGVLSHDQLLTDVNEAAEFVKATGVDALAIAIGTSHGAYKFTRPPTGAVLRIDRIKEIHARLPNTDLRMASTGAIRQFMNKDRKNFDPRKYLAEARKAMKEICKARYEAFGCAGQAAKIKAVALEKMAERYKKGELNAVVK